MSTCNLISDRADPADVALIRDCNLFDAVHYRRERGLPQATDDDLICDYIANWQTAKVEPAPHFDGESYIQRHLGGSTDLPPLLHFLRFGCQSGLNPWSEASVLAWQEPFLQDPDRAVSVLEQAKGAWPRLGPGARVAVHVHPQSHIVFHEFQSMLIAGFRHLGIKAQPAQADFETLADLRLIIAPHDFFYLDPRIDPALMNLKTCILFNTEQIPSFWFGRAYRFLRAAAGVLDINLQTAACLSQLGLPVRFLPLGRIEGFPLFQQTLPIPKEYADWSGTEAAGTIDADHPLAERPIDLLWIGSNARRRQAFWERAKPTFDQHASFVRLVNVKGALKADHPDAISGLAFAALARQSKILLNVHHFDAPYFEWQRLMHFGFLQGACVVSETVSQIPGMQPGSHYLQTDIAQLPAYVDWLLRDDEGRATLDRVRLQGQAAAMQHYDLPQTLAAIFLAHSGCVDGVDAPS